MDINFCTLCLFVQVETVYEHIKYVMHGFTVGGDVQAICRAAVNDEGKLYDIMDPDDFYKYMNTANEIMYKQLDKITRKTRRLTKMCMLMDYSESPIKLTSKSQQFTKAQGRNSKHSEFMYPQMQGKALVINLPKIIVQFWNVAKRFFSKNMVEKIAIVSADTSNILDTCPDAAAMFGSAERTPSFWGGTCNCENGCITGVSNGVRGKAVACDAEGNRSLTIGRRSKETISESVLVGMTVSYKVNVEAHSIPMKVEIVPEGCTIDDALIIQPASVIESSAGEATGSWEIDLTGTLVVTFDNSGSMMRSKAVTINLDFSDIDAAKSGMEVGVEEVDVELTE